MKTTNKYLLIAMLFGLVFHGSALFYTLESTYDALIHLFFGKHYSESWFEPWNYQWYTGFTVTSYPPLVHQLIALLSKIGGLKFGLFTVAISGILLFITGVYRFSYLLSGSKTIAGYSSILAVLSSSFTETLHLFGQLPSIYGISLLMIGLPNIYNWIRHGKRTDLIFSLSIISLTVTSHHVTPIFGMIFFIFPLIGMAVMDHAKSKLGDHMKVRFLSFLLSLKTLIWRIITFGFSTLTLIIFCILPYWINTKNNPITQVPIPHGSRDHFIEIGSSGLVFFLIPWGFLLMIWPYLIYRFFSRRYLFFGLSFVLLIILGTGGTTPIPKLILGENAFNILTLDRFTLWASIMAIPMAGELVCRFLKGDLRDLIRQRYSILIHRLSGLFIIGLIVFVTAFTLTLGYFRPSQPKPIDMLPIVNFLNQDEHDRWRYLTLGFGDQMSWLSAQTSAMTVDGNYHSARRLPELTSRAIERLENSKFKGLEGIGSLQQFLSVPEKYNLKYIFSNDKFYDPLLFFCGWHRLNQLENGIMVWERLNVPPVSKILQKDNLPAWQKIMWGVVPLSTIVVFLLLSFLFPKGLSLSSIESEDETKIRLKQKTLIPVQLGWGIFISVLSIYGLYQLYVKTDDHISPENAVFAYYDALDFKEFEKAYSLIDPEVGKSMSQFMLENALSDGLLSSYAKLNSINTRKLNSTNGIHKVAVDIEWTTPLESVFETKIHQLVQREGDWYLIPETVDQNIPTDQYLSKASPQFYNQGRRRISTKKTYHEDVLKQPEIRLINASLVKSDSSYVVVGMIQNVDNVPADISIRSTLYDDFDTELASFNAKFVMKHKLMPLEITPFKIEFEDVAWVDKNEEVPSSFDPSQFSPATLSDSPVKFDIHISSQVNASEKYTDLVVSELQIGKNNITAKLFNNGLNEITVPQLLMSYLNEEGELLWVDHHFSNEGIRQHRSQTIIKNIGIPEDLQVISKESSGAYVNGIPHNSLIGSDFFESSDIELSEKFLPVQGGEYSFLSVTTNPYIAQW